MALTPADINFTDKTISINKSLHRNKGKDTINPPKTPKGNRTITLPDFLCNILQKYLEQIYELSNDDRIFPYTKSFLYGEMRRGSKASGVKIIDS